MANEAGGAAREKKRRELSAASARTQGVARKEEEGGAGAPCRAFTLRKLSGAPDDGEQSERRQQSGDVVGGNGVVGVAAKMKGRV